MTPTRARRWVQALGALLLMLAVVGPAHAFPGPDRTPPQPTPFYLHIQEGPAQEIFDKVAFTWRTAAAPNGWDFGGRTGYSCGFGEGVDLAKVAGELIIQKWGQGGAAARDGDSLYSYINSSGWGATAGDQACGRPRVLSSGAYPGQVQIPQANAVELSRSASPGDCLAGPPCATGHVVQLLRPDGSEVGRVTLHHQSPYHPDFYWYRGDEPGELMGWYLERSTGEYGIVARLSCVPLVAGYACADFLTYS